jgi:GTP-binding protein
MKIKSAQFIKGAVGPDKVFDGNRSQVAFIGRSNVGKSSVINSLTGEKDLAKTSSFPGRTQQINAFLINYTLCLVDLPGYGYAKLSQEKRDNITQLINWYLFLSGYKQTKIFLIIDSLVGVTKEDAEILEVLDLHNKPVVIVANKVDRIRSKDYKKQIEYIKKYAGKHKVILYSAKTNLGQDELLEELI